MGQGRVSLLVANGAYHAVGLNSCNGISVSYEFRYNSEVGQPL